MNSSKHLRWDLRERNHEADRVPAFGNLGLFFFKKRQNHLDEYGKLSATWQQASKGNLLLFLLFCFFSAMMLLIWRHFFRGGGGSFAASIALLSSWRQHNLFRWMSFPFFLPGNFNLFCKFFRPPASIASRFSFLFYSFLKQLNCVHQVRSKLSV